MGSNLSFPQRSPELKLENTCNPSAQQKVVVLFEWWLMKAEKGYNGRRLTIGGFTQRGEAVGIFRSAPIIKRLDHCTLETADGIILRIQGPINKTRTIDNGLPLEASNAFLLGFPITWDNFTEVPSDGRMLEQQSENIFDPSFQQITVLLRNWWLRKAEKGSDGNRLAIGGFTKCGKAMRLFDSSPIIKRHDAYTLETADGITIRIEGFINKIRTLDNGFPLEACKTFLIGFPTTWANFANGSSWDKPSHAEIPVSGSRDADWSKDSLENVPLGFPAKSEGTILHNVPSTSNTSVRDSDTRLWDAIHKFTALASTCDPAHMPLVDRGYHHLPKESVCDNNRRHDNESYGVNMRDFHTNNQLQGDDSCGTNLRHAHIGYSDYGHTPVDNDSENHEASYTGVHMEGAGCLGDLHVDGFPQEKSLNHEKLEFVQNEALNICKKCNGLAVTKGHHDEGVETCSTSNLWDSVAGKDQRKEETALKRDEKFDECSTRRPEKVRLGLSNVKNLHGKDRKSAKFTAKPVRRSLRLKSLNPESVHVKFQDNCQFLNETNDCANLVSDGSKTCTISQPTDTLAEGCTSSPNLYAEAQKSAKSLARPVRKSERFVFMENANLSPDGSSTYARSLPDYTPSKRSPLSPLSSIFLPSSGVLSEKNQDGHPHSINTCLGVTPTPTQLSRLVEITATNSKAVTSQNVEKRMLRCSRKKKDNQTARSRVKVEQNDSETQSFGTRFEGNISFSPASFPRRKAKNVEVSTETQAEDKAYHKMGYKTVWVSTYSDVHCTPLTRYKKSKSAILTPESLNLKRSRSGRLLIPRLDCSMRVMYEPDGSFVGTANVDGSCAGTACAVMSTSPSKGRRTRKKRKKKQL